MALEKNVQWLCQRIKKLVFNKIKDLLLYLSVKMSKAYPLLFYYNDKLLSIFVPLLLQ